MTLRPSSSGEMSRGQRVGARGESNWGVCVSAGRQGAATYLFWCLATALFYHSRANLYAVLLQAIECHRTSEVTGKDGIVAHELYCKERKGKLTMRRQRSRWIFLSSDLEMKETARAKIYTEGKGKGSTSRRFRGIRLNAAIGMYCTLRL